MESELTTFSLGSNRWRRKHLLRYIHFSFLISFLKVGLHNRNRRSHAIFQLHVQRCFCFRRPCILQNNEQHKSFVLPIWFRHSVCTYSRAHQTCDTLRSLSFEIHTHSMSGENLGQWHLFERWCPRADLNHRNEGLQSGNIWLIYFNQYDPHRYIW